MRSVFTLQFPSSVSHLYWGVILTSPPTRPFFMSLRTDSSVLIPPHSVGTVTVLLNCIQLLPSPMRAIERTVNEIHKKSKSTYQTATPS